MPKIVVRFMSLEGKFFAVRKETFASLDAARVAVEAHAAAGGFSSVRSEIDGEGWCWNAKVAGGRIGRNVAFGEPEFE